MVKRVKEEGRGYRMSKCLIARKHRASQVLDNDVKKYFTPDGLYFNPSWRPLYVGAFYRVVGPRMDNWWRERGERCRRYFMEFRRLLLRQTFRTSLKGVRFAVTVGYPEGTGGFPSSRRIDAPIVARDPLKNSMETARWRRWRVTSECVSRK